jgi:DNA-directed RNA polymerase II subunit RPB1
MKRKLFNEEIDKIFNYIYNEIPKHYTHDIKESIIINIKISLLPQLEHIEIYPHLVEKLINMIIESFIKSLIQPGEMVGCIAASSIGEQNTQASLNSFHSSGLFKANLTSGVVRLNELLNASKIIKTPALTIYFDSSKVDTTDLFIVKELCNSELIFFDIQSVLKKYQLDYFSDINEFQEDIEYYNFYSNLFENRFINCNYRLRLIFDREILYKTKKSIRDIMETIIGYFKDSVDFCYFVFHSDNSCKLDIFFNDEICDPEDVLYKQEQEVLDELKNYINPDNKIIIFIEKIFLPSILPLKISGITGIEECYFNDDKDGTWFVDTKGGDYKEILLKEFVNFKKTKSNNMWDIFNMFGIEAARNFLIEDFSKIISVNHRHLDTMINSMTNTGKIMSVSRYGIDRKQVGPFAKAAFEQPFDNFFISATKGEIDNITGVSASVSLGKLANMGTGMIDVFINQNMIERELKNLENNKQKQEENIIEENIMVDEELLNY